MFEIIPEARREAAREALACAFGKARCASFKAVTGGASGALTYRAEVGGRPYLMRLEKGRDYFRNPERSFACMRTAAEAGIAPALHHADAAAGVAIMDFLPQRPLGEHPGGPEGLLRELATLFTKLQATPAFPTLGDYPAIVSGMLGYLRNSKVFADGLLDQHLEGFDVIRAAYPWDPSALVSSHNDANPRNILYDGRRLWLVDWELSFRNDPLTDIAILMQELTPTPELETVLLNAWLGHAPDRAMLARLTLMRQLVRMFYACIMLLTSIGTRPPETDLTPMDMADFQARVADGRITPATPETLHIVGKMVLAGFLDGLAAPGFEEALAVVRGGG